MEKGDDALERGDLTGALKAYEDGTGPKPRSEDARRWYRLGLALLDTKEEWAVNHARKSLYEALKANRELPGPRLELARFEIEARDYAEAERLLVRELGIEENPEARELLTLAQEHTSLARNAQDERTRQALEQRAAQDARYEQRKQVRLEEEQKRHRRKALLQKQTLTAGGLKCQTIDFVDLGKTIGDDILSTTAGGTFVSVLLKCENIQNRTGIFPWSKIVIIDAQGRQFSVDWDASLQFAVSKSDEEIANPEGLQLHPGLPRYIGMLFDLPPDIADDPGTTLAFGPHRFQLIFPPEPKPAGEAGSRGF